MQDRTKNVIQSTSAGVAAGVAIRTTADYIFRDTNLCAMIVPPLFAKPVTYTPAVVESITNAVSHEYQTIINTGKPLLEGWTGDALNQGFYNNGLIESATKASLNSMAIFVLNIAPKLLQDNAMQICGDYMKVASIIPTILWWSAAAGVAGGLYYTYTNWNKKPEEEQQKVSEEKYNPRWYAAGIEHNTIQPVIE